MTTNSTDLMHIAISFPPGFTVEGIVLQGCDRTLRVAVRNWDDIAIFRVRDGRWTAENGDAVTITPTQISLAAGRTVSSPNVDSAGIAFLGWNGLPVGAPATCN